MSVSATSSKPAASPKPAATPKPKADATTHAGHTPSTPSTDAKKKTSSTSDATSGARSITAADPMAGHDHTPGATDANGIPMEHATVLAPARNDPRFVAGTTGPRSQKEGDAPTVKIPDGPGFGGLEGRKQNANDKQQNNYSVTDANYNNQLGLLAKDPDTGQPMTYVKDIQTYNAAGYIETYAPKVYQQLADNQNAGRGTILGGAAHIMGLVKTADPSEQGVDTSSIPMTVPGTNLDAKQQVASPKDGTGQDWARMHHAESHWGMLKSMIDMGVDQKHAMEFSGDDAVSGSGRLNGVNNQDGASGFNAGELQVYKDAAAYDPSGKVILAMMQGHNHDTGIAPDAITNPAINKELGLASNDRSITAGRAAAIAAGLNNGTVHNNKNNDGGGGNGGGNGGGGGGGNPDVTAAEATGAGTGAINTVDTADPATALAQIGQAGFADGVTGTSAMRLAEILQQLLVTLLQGGQLDPAVLQALQALVPQLQASTDPNLQQMGQAIDALGKGVDPATGQLSPALVQQLAPVIAAFVATTGAAFSPELTAAAPELVAKATADAAAAGTAGMPAGMQMDPATGAMLAQPGGATLPVAGTGATTGATTGAAAAAGHDHGAAAAAAPQVTTTAKPPVSPARTS